MAEHFQLDPDAPWPLMRITINDSLLLNFRLHVDKPIVPHTSAQAPPSPSSGSSASTTTDKRQPIQQQRGRENEHELHMVSTTEDAVHPFCVQATTNSSEIDGDVHRAGDDGSALAVDSASNQRSDMVQFHESHKLDEQHKQRVNELQNFVELEFVRYKINGWWEPLLVAVMLGVVFLIITVTRHLNNPRMFIFVLWGGYGAYFLTVVAHAVFVKFCHGRMTFQKRRVAAKHYEHTHMLTCLLAAAASFPTYEGTYLSCPQNIPKKDQLVQCWNLLGPMTHLLTVAAVILLVLAPRIRFGMFQCATIPLCLFLGRLIVPEEVFILDTRELFAMKVVFFATGYCFLVAYGWNEERRLRRAFLSLVHAEVARAHICKIHSLTYDIVNATFPAKTARQLLRGQQVEDKSDFATVVCCALLGFNRWCKSRGAAEIADVVESTFVQLDVIAASYGLTTIQSFGDTYVAVIGLVEPDSSHLQKAKEFATSACSIAIDRRFVSAPGDPQLRWRVCIGTGSLRGFVVSNTTYIVIGNAHDVAMEALSSSEEPGIVICDKGRQGESGGSDTLALSNKSDSSGDEMLLSIEARQLRESMMHAAERNERAAKRVVDQREANKGGGGGRTNFLPIGSVSSKSKSSGGSSGGGGGGQSVLSQVVIPALPSSSSASSATHGATSAGSGASSQQPTTPTPSVVPPSMQLLSVSGSTGSRTGPLCPPSPLPGSPSAPPAAPATTVLDRPPAIDAMRSWSPSAPDTPTHDTLRAPTATAPSSVLPAPVFAAGSSAPPAAAAAFSESVSSISALFNIVPLDPSVSVNVSSSEQAHHAGGRGGTGAAARAGGAMVGSKVPYQHQQALHHQLMSVTDVAGSTTHTTTNKPSINKFRSPAQNGAPTTRRSSSGTVRVLSPHENGVGGSAHAVTLDEVQEGNLGNDLNAVVTTGCLFKQFTNPAVENSFQGFADLHGSHGPLIATLFMIAVASLTGIASMILVDEREGRASTFLFWCSGLAAFFGLLSPYVLSDDEESRNTAAIVCVVAHLIMFNAGLFFAPEKSFTINSLIFWSVCFTFSLIMWYERQYHIAPHIAIGALFAFVPLLLLTFFNHMDSDLFGSELSTILLCILIFPVALLRRDQNQRKYFVVEVLLWRDVVVMRIEEQKLQKLVSLAHPGSIVRKARQMVLRRFPSRQLSSETKNVLFNAAGLGEFDDGSSGGGSSGAGDVTSGFSYAMSTRDACFVFLGMQSLGNRLLSIHAFHEIIDLAIERTPQLIKAKSCGSHVLICGNELGEPPRTFMAFLARVTRIAEQHGRLACISGVVGFGPVIGALVGRHRITFELFGDTVVSAFQILGAAPGGTIVALERFCEERMREERTATDHHNISDSTKRMTVADEYDKVVGDPSDSNSLSFGESVTWKVKDRAAIRVRHVVLAKKQPSVSLPTFIPVKPRAYHGKAAVAQHKQSVSSTESSGELDDFLDLPEY